MSRHQTRLLVCAGVALGLILVSAFGMTWFTLRIEGLKLAGMGIDVARIDLRSIAMCERGGACISLPFSKVEGFYPTISTATFWSSIVLAIIVAVQAGSRIVRGVAGAGLTQIGYFAGVVCFLAAAMAGFWFAPETHAIGDVGVHVARSWTPLLMLAGVALALYTLRFAVAEELAPRPSLPVATAMPHQSQHVAPPPAEQPRKRAPSSIPFGAEAVANHPLQGKLNYVAALVEVSRAGIDARREDGVAKLVLWADVVGVVARRLPAAAPYVGETFVDVVSAAGSTLRIMPWTRWNGDVLADEGEDRPRAIVLLVASRCPGAQLDPATRTFVDGHDHAAQLRDIAALDAHDERVA